MHSKSESKCVLIPYYSYINRYKALLENIIMQSTIKHIIILFFIFLSLSSCSNDESYPFSEEDIQGEWKLDGIYKYYLSGNLTDVTNYNLVWNIDLDSIESIQSYDFEDIGTGVLKQRFEYSLYPNGIFQFWGTKSKIQSLNHEEFIFSVNNYIPNVTYHMKKQIE